MANNQIGKYGGTVVITASSTPTGHNITTVDKPDWITDVMTGATWSGNVTENTTEEERSGGLSVTIATVASSSYNPESTAITCAFTITQKAGEVPPTPTTSVTVTFTNNCTETCWGEATLGVGDWDEFTVDYGQHKSSNLEIDSSTFAASITVTCHFTEGEQSPALYYTYGSSGMIALGPIVYSDTEYDFNTPELTYVAGTTLFITIA